MNRRYTTKQFYEIAQKLRNAYNDVILTTDVIVGFPGETDEEFAKTYDFLKKVKFYKMHVFKYSVRNGTKAEKMENQIPESMKEERSKKLIALSDKNQKEINSQYIGKDVEVLVEEEENGFYKGHTANYMQVKFKSNGEDYINRIVCVKH